MSFLDFPIKNTGFAGTAPWDGSSLKIEKTSKRSFLSSTSVEDKRPWDATSFFVRKDKQANTTGAHNAAVGLFIVFSPTGKTSKPTATLQANTTGDGNVAVGQGSSFCQKRQASRIQALDGSFLSEKTSKQLSTGYPQVIQ